MRNMSMLFIIVLMVFLFSGCSSSGGGSKGTEDAPNFLVVNSLLDPAARAARAAAAPDEVMTFRSAVEKIADGGTISFDASLDGGVVALSIVGEDHTVLKGEVMGFDYANNISYLIDYLERDYGKSALYARKNLVIDASALPNGITLEWTGGESARVLAVYGNLTMNNVTVTGGNSVAEEIDSFDDNAEPGEENSQPWTLGRGGAVAVWGVARLTNCTLYDNYCEGDFSPSRDRGAFGGGLYADIVHLSNSIVSGNSVVGAGAAGGGVYSVGGADDGSGSLSTIEQSSITGNRISGHFTYGGGVYSDGGGIGHLKTLSIINSTIAQNVVEPYSHPESIFPSFLRYQIFWRGGGIYMSNGYLQLYSSTVVENEVYGYPRTNDGFKPNMAGGIVATIGNAHTVETMVIEQSIIAGNVVYELDYDLDYDLDNIKHEYYQDVFTGSLLHFYSYGYNLIGQLNFDHILVPVPPWESLNRKHWPETGDQSGVSAGEILGTAETHAKILSQGVNAGDPVVLWYPPAGDAVGAVPDDGYSVTHTLAEIDRFNYRVDSDKINDFLSSVVSEVGIQTGLNKFADDFIDDFEDYLGTVDTDEETDGLQPYTNPQGEEILTLTDTLWFGPATTWPSEEYNQAWIDFWHRLDTALEDYVGVENLGIGVEKLGDTFWSDFTYNNVENNMEFITNDRVRAVEKAEVDQLGVQRIGNGDIGAIER